MDKVVLPFESVDKIPESKTAWKDATSVLTQSCSIFAQVITMQEKQILARAIEIQKENMG